jgi:hypothetical protein
MSQPARIPNRFAMERTGAKRKVTKNALMDRPATRKDSGTKDTAFRGRRKAKRVRVRKLQRQARRVQR